MKKLLLIKSKSLLTEGLIELVQTSGEFQMVAHHEDLDSLAETQHNERSPLIIVISSAILDTASRCEQYLKMLKKEDGPLAGCSIRTMILIQENHELMIDMYHEQGINGFLFEKASFKEFEQALLAQFEGAVYLPSYVAEERIYKPGPRRFPMVPLTQREQEVLRFLSQGMTSRTISSRLDISVSTVDVHRKKIQSKLDVHTIAELTKYALRMGLTSL